MGLLEAVDIPEDKKLVVSAFSSNVSTPHGEVDTVIEQALENFVASLAGISEVEQVEQCIAPHWDRCSTLQFRR